MTFYRYVILGALATVMACAGASSATTAATSTTPASPSLNSVSSTKPGVSLHLRRANGEPLFLERFRGKPLLLFIFTTYDGSSQLGLNALSEYAKTHPQLAVVAIAVQPVAERILPMFENAVNAPFPLTYDPDETVLQGKSSLGEVQMVPCYIVLNETGQVIERHYGALDPHALEKFVN